jgi:hypothetical protein
VGGGEGYQWRQDSNSGWFLYSFFQKCWEVMKENILAVFKEFDSRGKFEKTFNVAFISLIPKKASVVDIKDSVLLA